MSKENHGVGRPVEMKDTPKKRGMNYSFYLSEEQLKQLDDAHWRERKSLSEIVREAIDDWLRNHAEGNSTFKLDKWQEDPDFIALPTLLSSKEKWNKYVDSCNDKDLTQIAIKSRYVNDIVAMRRTKERYEKAQEERFAFLNKK